MEFNLDDKREVLHYRRLSAKGMYTVNGMILRSIDLQRNFGVKVHRFLKLAIQVESGKSVYQSERCA